MFQPTLTHIHTSIIRDDKNGWRTYPLLPSGALFPFFGAGFAFKLNQPKKDALFSHENPLHALRKGHGGAKSMFFREK